jgi:hypothetical protein
LLIDRTHRKWFFVSAIILALATAAYVVYANQMPNGPRGGTVAGLTFGIIGSLMMTFAGLLAGRKQFPIAEIPIPLTGKRLRLGTSQFWLRGHIWMGLLSVPMILFHSGFAWGGVVENALWIVFGIVVLSGLFGLVAQQVFPRLLTARVPVETFVQQIPYQCTRTKILSDRLVAEACGKLDVRNEPLFPVFTKIAEFYKSAGKDDKDQWINLVGDEHRSLFLDLATYAKQNRMIRMEADFARFLEEVYTGLDAGDGAAKPPGRAAAEADRAEATPDQPPAPKKPSPLDQMRAKAGGAKPGPAEAAGGAKAASPLERARVQAGAAGNAPSGGNGDGESAEPAAGAAARPLSKLEQARAAARNAGGAGTMPSPSERAGRQSPGVGGGKPLSKLEQARADAAARKTGGTVAEPAAASQGVAVAAPAAKPAPAAGDMPGGENEQANVAAEQAQPPAPNPAAPGIPRAKRAKGRHRANISMSRSMTVADLTDCVELACPFCEFEVQLRDRNLLGRPARCPNCREKFMLIEPEDHVEAEPVAVGASASPLARARAEGASKRSPAGDGGQLPPLERARAQAAAQRGETPAAAGSSPPAPVKKSPLERAREQAGAGATIDDPAAIPGSPLEKARAQAAAKGQPAEPAEKQPPMPSVAQKTPAGKKPAGKPAAGKPAAPAGPIPRTADLKAFYLGEVRPFLDYRGDLDSQLATTDTSGRVFTQMRVELPTELHPILGALEQNCEQRRQFVVQKRIHRWLHWWLVFHIPASAALFVLFVVHVVMALRVTPWAM